MPGVEAQVVGTELERVLPQIKVLFDRDDTFYSQIEKRPVEIVSARDAYPARNVSAVEVWLR